MGRWVVFFIIACIFAFIEYLGWAITHEVDGFVLFDTAKVFGVALAVTMAGILCVYAFFSTSLWGKEKVKPDYRATLSMNLAYVPVAVAALLYLITGNIVIGLLVGGVAMAFITFVAAMQIHMLRNTQGYTRPMDHFNPTND